MVIVTASAALSNRSNSIMPLFRSTLNRRISKELQSVSSICRCTRYALVTVIIVGIAAPTTLVFGFGPSYQHFNPTSSWHRQHKDRFSRCTSSVVNVSMNALSGPDIITKQDLGVKLSEVRDYYRQSNEMSQANVVLSLLRTRLPNVPLNRCFVSQSTINDAGKGVFASRDISVGELITMYPGDALLIKKDASESNNDEGQVGVMFGSHVLKEEQVPSRLSTHQARAYEIKISSTVSIVADPLVNIDGEGASYLGHFVNDGASLENNDLASSEVYLKATADRCNAGNFVMEGCHVATVATKAIVNGEEVFVSYGEGYWLTRSSPSQSDIAIAPGDNNVIGVDANTHIAGNDRSVSANSSSSRFKRDKKKKKKQKMKNLSNPKGERKGFGA